MSNRRIRYLLILVFIFSMFLMSEITGEKEMIFPEILAVLSGAWCTEKMLWRTGRIRMAAVMAAAAFIGAGIARFVPAPLYAKAMIGFAAMALLLTISDCRMSPALSACMLPIFIEVNAFRYAFLAAIMAVIVSVGQKLMVQFGIKEGNVHSHYMPDFEEELKLWAILFVAFMLLSVYPLMSGNIYVMLPPLIAVFLDNATKNFRGRRVRIWSAVLLGGLIGGLCQFVLVDWFRWPVCIAGTIAAAWVLWSQRCLKINFPAACSAALWAFLIPEWVMIYPFAIAVGGTVMMLVSTYIQKKFIIMEER